MKMTLREKQSVFAKNVGKLILWAFENGYELTLGEAYRTEDQQLLYFEGYTIIKAHTDLHLVKASRKSKTMSSKHLTKMAIDLNLFIGGVYQTRTDVYKPLATYWKSLHPDNVAGYDWGFDGNHFEMK